MAEQGAERDLRWDLGGRGVQLSIKHIGFTSVKHPLIAYQQKHDLSPTRRINLPAHSLSRRHLRRVLKLPIKCCGIFTSCGFANARQAVLVRRTPGSGARRGSE